VTAALPGGGEDRPGQVAMAEAVARAVEERRHLVVGAGTGTGKSFAYLVPAALSGRRVVVATATRALQDQLAGKDLPLVAAGVADTVALRWAVVKGRANYLCRQRALEVGGAVEEPSLSALALFEDPGGGDGPGAGGDRGRPVDLGRLGGQIRRLLAWAEDTPTGDRAELDFEPHPRAWAALSVSARECPGAFRCPSGTVCFAERARERAAEAHVVVVNTHLYATHVASDGAVLPEHDVVVLDEAHAVEDVMTAALGVELTAGRLHALAQAARGLVGEAETPLADAVDDAAERLEGALVPLVGRRVLGDPTGEAELAAVLALAAGRLEALGGALRRGGEDGAGDPGARGGGAEEGDTGARRARAQVVVGHLLEELGTVAALDEDHVAWVESQGPGGRTAVLRAAPVEVGPVLAARLWPRVTAVLTSATLPPGIGGRLGLPPAATDELDVGSPFPYRRCALLYCATHLPDPRRPGAAEALHEELAALITAAGGRTLALFTSWRAMQGAAADLRHRVAFPILAQGDLPKVTLLERFSAEPAACLFATMSFWQGVDVPGPTLSLVTLDRLPFPRPDDPLLQARRERAGEGAFRLVDLPRAATLLAQGAGRLIRSATDTGVVAVLDPRLARAGYRRVLLDTMPPMRRTVDRAEVCAFLQAAAAAHAGTP
ncbi:MAG TPA: ATP-dependent DNA helicase, partial [Acidimicrobiales bacterium]|nr:ATP-dependent DNA helicase [Acidimicrobiales bacterium]